MSSRDMTDIEQLRALQHQRLVPSLAMWNEAKKNLEDAIALTETREREYRELSDDVQRKIEAIDLVANLSKELGVNSGDRSRPTAPPTPTSMQSLAGPERRGAFPTSEPREKTVAARVSVPGGAQVTRSSRPLFSLNRLSAIAGVTLSK